MNRTPYLYHMNIFMDKVQIYLFKKRKVGNVRIFCKTSVVV